LALQAQLEIAHLHFRNRERALALSSIERFIKLNPSSPALDYAMYLRGVINFNDDLGFLGGLAKRDLSERDQQASRDAYQSFKLLVDQFPNSPYSADARVRMDYIVNALAEYEVHVAKYYYRRGAYLAAANRAQFAVTEYPQAPALEEALNLMSLSYDQLGLTQLRDDARRVLAKSFPQSRYLKGDAGIGERSGWRLW
jgi:outer membrane protein assembly factor BamD